MLAVLPQTLPTLVPAGTVLLVVVKNLPLQTRMPYQEVWMAIGEGDFPHGRYHLTSAPQAADAAGIAAISNADGSVTF